MKTKVFLIISFLFALFVCTNNVSAKVNGKPGITINSDGTISFRFCEYNEKSGAGDYHLMEIKILLKSFDGNSSVTLYEASRGDEGDSWPQWSKAAGTVLSSTKDAGGDWRHYTVKVKYNKAIYDILATYPDCSKNVKFYVYQREDDDSGSNNHYHNDYTDISSSSFYKIPTAELINITQKESSCNTYTLEWKINSTREYSNSLSPNLEVLRNGTVIKTFSYVSGSTSGSTLEFTDNAIYTGPVKYQIRYSSTRDGSRIYTGISSVSKSFSALTHPSSVSTSFDQCTKKIKLELKMPTFSSTDHDASTPFYVERYVSDSINGYYAYDKEFNINFSTSTPITYEDSDGLANKKYYYYKIKRHLWDISCKSVTSAKVQAIFSHPVPPTPKADTTNKKIKVTWTTPADFCGNTKLKLIVHNLSTGSETTKNIGDGETSYIMNSVQLCTKYAFTLVYATTNYGDMESVMSNTIIMTDTLKIGNKLDASKGYYTDKITLNWESPTPALIDDWVVMRRELPDGGYSLVSRFANNNADEINYVDLDAQPGITYQYKVQGASKCADTTFWTSEITSVGFRQPLGMVMGTITYGTGVAVKDVTVVAEVVEESSYISKGKSISFPGSNSYIEVSENKPYLDADNFTIQFWVKPTPASHASKTLLAYKDQIKVGFNSAKKLYFIVGNKTLVSNMPDTAISSKEFTHITAVFNKSAAKNNLQIFVNGRVADSLTAAASFAMNKQYKLYIGAKDTTNAGEFFKGYIDDFRVWKTALTEDDIAFNYSSVLSGKETDLGLYIRGEEGVTKLNGLFGEAYDISYISYTNTYNANHARVRNISFDKDNIPTSSQLGYKGKTDENGTYTIAGIPFSGSGTTYRITPSFDVHDFKPKNQTLYIGVSNIVHNKIDFEDISSFKVSGYVYYEGTSVGVNGVMFAVDGNTCVREGKIIESGTTTGKGDGYYEIEVPIGFHSVSASKQGHTFASVRSNPGGIENSRFPANELTQYDFQTEETINFNDVTKVELIGRFVGGPVEAAKPVGFGITNNNIGQATITLQLQKSGYINQGEDISSIDTMSSGKIITEKIVKNNPSTGKIEVTFTTDSLTGEFVAYLFPEEYKVLINGTNEIVVNKDSTNTYKKVYADPIVMNVNRTTVNLYDTDTMTVKPGSSAGNEFEQDTVQRNIIDSTSYHNLMDVIFRVSPSIEVLDYTNKDEIFGEREYVVRDKVGEILDTLMLIDEDDKYALTHPVFIQQRSYAMEVSIFEQYVNQDNDSIDRVPTVDGDVIVTNTMAAVNLAEIDEGDIDAVAETLATGEVLELNEEGKTIYAFVTGVPNITVNTKPEENYLKSLNFRVEFSDGTPPKKWKEDDMRTYVLGAYSDGSNFVTRGPNVVDFILRDPPGSSSYAWIEEGSEIESTHEWGGRFENETGLNTELKFGMELTTWVGMGGGTATTVGSKNTTNIGAKTTNGGGRDNTFSTTYSFNKRIQTSSDPLYTGTFGDIFIGSSYNIIFGQSRMIDIFDASASLNNVPYEVEGKSGTIYSIGSQNGMTVTPEFQTDFQYSYHYIVFELIPHLELLRNSFFTHYEKDITGNPSKSAYYVSKLPIDDENLGKDTTTYYVVFPDSQVNDPNAVLTDSIHFYNKEIAAWENLLAQNEQEKVKATKLKNLSFDAGVVYEETHSRDTTNAYTLVYEGSLNVDANTQFGTDVAGVGAEFTITFNNKGSWFNKNSNSEKKTINYGFHLEDGDDDDYYTVDILEPLNNSTAYRVLGGQSSCPYQDDEFAEYFEPEKKHVIHQATARVEDPSLSVNTALLTNIPGNQSANFTLTLGNNSLIEEVWYKLVVDESTNPDGLNISIDGQALGNGRIFLLDPSSAYNKTLSVKKTRPDINKYDSIRLILHSQCQYDPATNREDIYDEVYISVEFLPSCSDLVINRPFENQIINTYTGDTLNIEVSEYDLNYKGFKNIVLEQKSTTENVYTAIAYYYKDAAGYNQDSTIAASLKHYIGTNGIISHDWKAPTLDGKYNIRARSLCPAGAATVYESVSDVITITKDMVSPVPFGTPQPADGILSIGDDLLLKFNEDIQGDYSYRISIEGELNGDELAHNSGLLFDGVNDKMEVVQAMNLAGKSFTVEFWTLREGDAKEATLFSHGNAESRFEIGLTADDKLQVTSNGNTVTSLDPVKDINKSWTHIAVTYDASENMVTAYRNGEPAAIISSQNVGEYNATGNITVGTNFEKNKYYNGRMNELRVWTKALSSSIINIQKNTKLSGTEIGLTAYWPMNEARGTFVNENIRGRNGSTNATWFVLPAGRSLEFDGIDQYAKTSILPEIEETADFSVEFWFRADEDNTDACIFSTGRGDNQDFQATNKKFSIYFDDNKDLILRTANKKEVIASQLADNDWHHLALSVNRRGNANVYIDSELKKAFHAADYFGMFSGVNLSLGAMIWETNATTTNVGSYFKGNIDDLRIWKSALTKDGIKLAASSRLKGDEAGLRAYYPFDTTESATLIYGTLSDQLIASIGDEKVDPNIPFELINGADFTTTAANIKPCRMLKPVEFTRVYSNDQIYLQIDAPMKRIENCILEISVSDVRDLNGNALENTIRWTAYIDQNYLKWSEEKLSFIKDEFEPLSFVVRASNKSGSEQAFTIENLPSWLSATPSTGVIPPTGSIEIRFVVNEGLNIGIYDENIYLKNSDGVNELLALDLRVIGNEPDWTVDPTKYDYSMNIFGQLEIEGIISSDEMDKIAAFNGNECVGVSTLTYQPEYDNYIAYLTVYGNTENTPLSFRIWDASTGRIYPEVLPDNIIFRNATFQGTPGNPTLFQALNIVEQNIPLQAGWNWISTNVENDNMARVNGSYTGFTFANNNEIKSQLRGFVRYSQNNWGGNLITNGGILSEEMYMVKVNNDGVLKFTGKPVDPASKSIAIKNGWTWIGYTPQVNLDVNEAFAGLDLKTGDLVKSQTEFSMYDEVLGWLGSLKYLVPGRGYMLYTKREGQVIGDLTYPTTSSLTSHTKGALTTKLKSQQAGELPLFENNQSIVAEVISDEEFVVDNTTKLYCYYGNECRGIAQSVWVDDFNKYLFFISVGGSDNTDNLRFEVKSKDQTKSIVEKCTFKSNSINGDIHDPVQLTMGETAQDQIAVFPNPFKAEFSVKYTAPEGTTVITLVDVMGRTIEKVSINHVSEGTFVYEFNKLKDLTPGTYVIIVTNENGSQSQKLIKQ